MDVEDFTREVQPHHRRSRLEKYKQEIRDLKKQGYSDMQVRDWLAQNGIAVSRENVRKFIKRHLTKEDTAQVSEQPSAAPPAPGIDQGAQLATAPGAAASAPDLNESPAERMRRLAREQRDEAAQTQFKHDKTGNNH
jgi:hypothetical protein